MSKIINDELFSRQKNDICDYVLYLFNKYDSVHFLDSHSNAENERLLKTTTSKIKASKKNISVKFMSDIEYQQVFKDFLNSLANDNPKSIVKQKENGDLEFTIENNVLKDILESKLKKWANTTFTYTLT